MQWKEVGEGDVNDATGEAERALGRWWEEHRQSTPNGTPATPPVRRGAGGVRRWKEAGATPTTPPVRRLPKGRMQWKEVGEGDVNDATGEAERALGRWWASG